MTDAKEAARAAVDASRDELTALSRRIHANPELGYEEEQASAWLEETLDAAGFTVEAGICGLPTAFRATKGSGPLHIVACAEYDALPGIGHACGHNVIAASAVGAGIGAAAVADDAGLTITVMGTPAEEVLRSGGKIRLLEGGAFEGAHAAMMTHPAPWDVAVWPIVAASFFEVHYEGKAAHASGFPEQGVNARRAHHRPSSDRAPPAAYPLYGPGAWHRHSRRRRVQHHPGARLCRLRGARHHSRRPDGGL